MDDSSDECCDDDGAEEAAPHLISNLAILEMIQPRVDARLKNLKGTTNSTGTSTKNMNNKQLRHRDWIEQHVVEYLQGTACTQFTTAAHAANLQTVLRSPTAVGKTATTPATTATTAKKLQGFNLTEAESLQIINLSPSEPVEIHLLVDELQDRMSVSQQEELLKTIQRYRQNQEANKSSMDCDPSEKAIGLGAGGLEMNGVHSENDGGENGKSPSTNQNAKR